MSGKNTRGFSLGAALLTFLVAFVVLATIATTSTLSLQMGAQVENSQAAQRLAASVVHQGVANIIKNPTFHSDLLLQEGDGKAVLTFQKTGSTPYSTNNWEGNSPIGWERGVPRGMIHLVGVASVHGVERRVETLVDMPVYPMTVACSGPLVLENSTVASVKDNVLDRELSEILASPLGPANVGTNAAGAGDSLLIQTGSHITGFVQSCGSIRNLGGKIDGEIRAYWPIASDLPVMSSSQLDPRKPDPSDENVIYSKLPPSTYPSLEVNGYSVITGNVQVNGPLTLNDSLLLVDGDLTVTGGLNGQGAIGVRGNVKVSGASHLRAQSRVAVLADGDISLLGTGRESQRFEGLLYSRGSIRVESVTLLGSCIQNAPPDSPANRIGVTIANSNVFFNTRGSGPSFNPPVDAIMPSLTGVSSVEDVQGPASREPDSVVGRTTRRRSRSGGPVGPGNVREVCNAWRADDLFVLRMQFDAQHRPRFAVMQTGRASNGGDDPELRNPDGTLMLGAGYFESMRALLDDMGQGFGGGVDLYISDTTILAMLADITRSYPPNGKNNFPNIIACGIDGSGGFHEYGDGCDVNETEMREGMRASINAMLARCEQLSRRSPDANSYYTLDPSRFLSRSRAVRLHYWREF